MAKERNKARRHAQAPAPLVTPLGEPRTGVGTPDDHVAPAGMALGGDTGDVGTPRDTLGTDIGSPHGASAEPESSTIWHGFEKPTNSKHTARKTVSEGGSMPREHFNDIPGDIAGSERKNLPGGFGADDPDDNLDAIVDELAPHDVRAPDGEGFYYRDQRGGDTTGAGYTEETNTGSSVPLQDLLEGEED